MPNSVCGKTYSPPLLLHHFHGQIRRPERLIDAVAPRAHVVPHLHSAVLELQNRLDDPERAVHGLGRTHLEELRLEERLGVVVLQQLRHERDGLGHRVEMAEDGRAVALPDLLPHRLGVRPA